MQAADPSTALLDAARLKKDLERSNALNAALRGLLEQQRDENVELQRELMELLVSAPVGLQTPPVGTPTVYEEGPEPALGCECEPSFAGFPAGGLGSTTSSAARMLASPSSQASCAMPIADSDDMPHQPAHAAWCKDQQRHQHAGGSTSQLSHVHSHSYGSSVGSVQLHSTYLGLDALASPEASASTADCSSARPSRSQLMAEAAPGHTCSTVCARGLGEESGQEQQQGLATRLRVSGAWPQTPFLAASSIAVEPLHLPCTGAAAGEQVQAWGSARLPAAHGDEAMCSSGPAAGATSTSGTAPTPADGSPVTPQHRHRWQKRHEAQAAAAEQQPAVAAGPHTAPCSLHTPSSRTQLKPALSMPAPIPTTTRRVPRYQPRQSWHQSPDDHTSPHKVGASSSRTGRACVTTTGHGGGSRGSIGRGGAAGMDSPDMSGVSTSPSRSGHLSHSRHTPKTKADNTPKACTQATATPPFNMKSSAAEGHAQDVCEPQHYDQLALPYLSIAVTAAGTNDLTQPSTPVTGMAPPSEPNCGSVVATPGLGHGLIACAAGAPGSGCSNVMLLNPPRLDVGSPQPATPTACITLREERSSGDVCSHILPYPQLPTSPPGPGSRFMCHALPAPPSTSLPTSSGLGACLGQNLCAQPLHQHLPGPSLDEPRQRHAPQSTATSTSTCSSVQFGLAGAVLRQGLSLEADSSCCSEQRMMAEAGSLGEGAGEEDDVTLAQCCSSGMRAFDCVVRGSSEIPRVPCSYVFQDQGSGSGGTWGSNSSARLRHHPLRSMDDLRAHCAVREVEAAARARQGNGGRSSHCGASSSGSGKAGSRAGGRSSSSRVLRTEQGQEADMSIAQPVAVDTAASVGCNTHPSPAPATAQPVAIPGATGPWASPIMSQTFVSLTAVPEREEITRRSLQGGGLAAALRSSASVNAAGTQLAGVVAWLDAKASGSAHARQGLPVLRSEAALPVPATGAGPVVGRQATANSEVVPLGTNSVGLAKGVQSVRWPQPDAPAVPRSVLAAAVAGAACSSRTPPQRGACSSASAKPATVSAVAHMEAWVAERRVMREQGADMHGHLAAPPVGPASQPFHKCRSPDQQLCAGPGPGGAAAEAASSSLCTGTSSDGEPTEVPAANLAQPCTSSSGPSSSTGSTADSSLVGALPQGMQQLWQGLPGLATLAATTHNQPLYAQTVQHTTPSAWLYGALGGGTRATPAPSHASAGEYAHVWAASTSGAQVIPTPSEAPVLMRALRCTGVPTCSGEGPDGTQGALSLRATSISAAAEGSTESSATGPHVIPAVHDSNGRQELWQPRPVTSSNSGASSRPAEARLAQGPRHEGQQRQHSMARFAPVLGRSKSQVAALPDVRTPGPGSKGLLAPLPQEEVGDNFCLAEAAGTGQLPRSGSATTAGTKGLLGLVTRTRAAAGASSAGMAAGWSFLGRQVAPVLPLQAHMGGTAAPKGLAGLEVVLGSSCDSGGEGAGPEVLGSSAESVAGLGPGVRAPLPAPSVLVPVGVHAATAAAGDGREHAGPDIDMEPACARSSKPRVCPQGHASEQVQGEDEEVAVGHTSQASCSPATLECSPHRGGQADAWSSPRVPAAATLTQGLAQHGGYITRICSTSPRTPPPTAVPNTCDTVALGEPHASHMARTPVLQAAALALERSAPAASPSVFVEPLTALQTDHCEAASDTRHIACASSQRDHAPSSPPAAHARTPAQAELGPKKLLATVAAVLCAPHTPLPLASSPERSADGRLADVCSGHHARHGKEQDALPHIPTPPPTPTTAPAALAADKASCMVMSRNVEECDASASWSLMYSPPALPLARSDASGSASSTTSIRPAVMARMGTFGNASCTPATAPLSTLKRGAGLPRHHTTTGRTAGMEPCPLSPSRFLECVYLDHSTPPSVLPLGTLARRPATAQTQSTCSSSSAATSGASYGLLLRASRAPADWRTSWWGVTGFFSEQRTDALHQQLLRVQAAALGRFFDRARWLDRDAAAAAAAAAIGPSQTHHQSQAFQSSAAVGEQVVSGQGLHMRQEVRHIAAGYANGVAGSGMVWTADAAHSCPSSPLSSDTLSAAGCDEA